MTGNDLGEHGLLNRQKRPHFAAAGADDANRPGDDQEHEVAGGGERDAGGGHERGTDDEHAPPPDPVGSRGEIKGHDNVPGQREGQQHARLGGAEAEARQIKHQHHG